MKKEDKIWKETVRAIYDELHFGKYTIFNDDAARHICDIIEKRHAEYFCQSSKNKKKSNKYDLSAHITMLLIAALPISAIYVTIAYIF